MPLVHLGYVTSAPSLKNLALKVGVTLSELPKWHPSGLLSICTLPVNQCLCQGTVALFSHPTLQYELWFRL
ncbi:hypothetical protein CJ030_MR7G018912 [Morella rubra]|uniref:Uncharacterized protein n=1 Tax=Morella rubra TaxID=262757 RepID=A0A6A1V3C3_9ROSI|nr:hypothetical protein CJ030_MR7G018912 [Morella rubra]